jgi:hypothetical protein
MMSSKQTIPEIDTEEEELRQERRETRMQRRKHRQRARIILWGTIGSSIILLGLMGFIFLRLQTTLTTNSAYPPINGISCDAGQDAYHIHTHLTIYINGKRVTIPQNIGIASDGSCFYWMHTHTDDGIIHIEAPQKLHNLALDDFLTIWHDGFTNLNFPPELTQSTGWKIYVNGQPFADIVTSPLTTEVQLATHDIVTLEYGTPDPKPDDASTYQFPANLKQ